MTGRPGYRTMEMIGGSSAPYLARTPCVPLFCTSFNRVGNKERFRLPGAGGGSLPLYGGTFARSYSVSILQGKGLGAPDSSFRAFSLHPLRKSKNKNQKIKKWLGRHVCRTKPPPKNFLIDPKNGLKNAKKDPKNDPKRVWPLSGRLKIYHRPFFTKVKSFSQPKIYKK